MVNDRSGDLVNVNGIDINHDEARPKLTLSRRAACRHEKGPDNPPEPFRVQTDGPKEPVRPRYQAIPFPNLRWLLWI